MKKALRILASASVALLLMACATSDDPSTSDNPELPRTSVSQASRTTPAQSAAAQVRPAVFVTEEGDLRLAFQFKNRDGTETERRVAGIVSADQIVPSKCFQTRTVETEYRTSGANAAISVIACTQDNGDITLGLLGRRENEYGDEGERFITTRIKAERMRGGVWFSSSYSKQVHELIPAARVTPSFPRKSTVPASSLEVDTGARSKTVCDIHGGTWTGGRCLKYHERPIITQSVESACRKFWGTSSQYNECVSYCKSVPTDRTEMCGRR